MATPIDELKILVTAEVAKAIADLDKTEKKTNQTASAFAKLRDAMQGPVAAGQMVVRMLGQAWAAMDKMVMAAVESERAVSNLNAVLKSTGGVAGLTEKELLSLADSMAKTTLLEDDMVVQSEAVLLTFKEIGRDVFPQAMMAAADLAQVMGMDLQSATVMLGKALNEPVQGIGALRRVGVQLTDEQEEQVKSFMAVNDIASAQAVIMKEVQSQVGGAAEAAANTATGGFLQLKKAMGELVEESGRSIARLIDFNAIAMKIQEAADKQAQRTRESTFTDIINDLFGSGSSFTAGQINISKIGKEIDEVDGSLQEFLAHTRDAQAFGRARLEDPKLGKQERKDIEARVQSLGILANSIEYQIGQEEKLKKKQEELIKQAEEKAKAEEEAAIAADEAAANEVAQLGYVSQQTEDALTRRYQAWDDFFTEKSKIVKDATDDDIEAIEEVMSSLDELIAMYDREEDSINNRKDKEEEAREAEKKLNEERIKGLEDFSNLLGAAFVSGEQGWKSLGKAALDVLASMVEGLAKESEVEAATALAKVLGGDVSQIPALAQHAANIALAYGAAGAIRAIPMAEGGMGTVTKPTLFLAGEAGPEDFAFGPKRKGGLSGMTIIQNIGGSVIAEKQLEAMAVGAVRKASRGY